MRGYLFPIALIAALAPLAAADPGLVSAEVSNARLDLEFGEFLGGSDASGLREDIDEEGNADGVVTTDEVEAYQRGRAEQIQDTGASGCFDDFSFLRLDGRAPTGIRELRVNVDRAEGPITSTEGVYRGNTFLFDYEPGPERPLAVMNFTALEDAYGAIVCSYGWTGWEEWAWDWASWWTFALNPLAPTEGMAQPADQQGGSAGASDEPPILVVSARTGHTIDPGTIEPPTLLTLWDDEAHKLTADTDAERDLLMAHELRFRVEGGATPDDWKDRAREAFVVVGVVGTGGVGVGALVFFTTEIGRYRFLKLLAGVPLFTRFEKDEVLEHNTREQLYQYIRNNPGPSFSDLRRALELSNGTLVHHLRILETQEFVKPVRDGFRTRFYLRGPRIVPTTYLTRTQITILEAIHSNPGVTQKELAQILGLPRESVFYHARKLESVGKLRVSKEGKWRKYFPVADETPQPLAGATGV